MAFVNFSVVDKLDGEGNMRSAKYPLVWEMTGE